METTEKERTGISNLKVNYNKTFGYYISLPRSKADFAPKDYVRKQTLVNEERYITTELKEKENIILTAVDELNKLEYEIFSDLRRQVAEFSPEIREVADKSRRFGCVGRIGRNRRLSGILSPRNRRWSSYRY
ncbi:MAG UNVERIFIED_CONTAM: hypothetical protein LVR29_28605 [Microcystis novacekii LVE1205-3]